MKNIKLIAVGTIALAILIGCGGSSSTTTTTVVETASTATPETNTTTTESDTTACVVDGNTVVGTNGTTCKDGEVTVACSADSRVTVAGALSGNTVTLNGRTYSCQ